MLINLRNALMAGKRLPYDSEVEYLRVDAIGPYIVIDGVTYCDAVGTYYAFTISSGGVVTHDLIPVRRGNTGYMYDRITNKRFGNAGTGDFVLGPDVVPVEYLESTGTQYIVTPKILNSNTEEGAYIEVDVRPQAQAQSQYGVIYSQGSSLYGSPLSILANRGVSTITTFFTGVAETAMSTTGDRIKVRVEHESSAGWGVFANGTRVRSNRMSGNYTFGDTSFGAFNAGANKVASGTRFYSMSSSAYNLRPVRVGSGSTWEGAMMDVLTRRIYRNAGTGDFGYGNDLKYPIPAS